MKTQVYLIENECGEGYFTNSLDDIMAELEHHSQDDDKDVKYKITITTMDREKFESLPEADWF